MGRIMVFAPHPDDDIIGCGGSIAKRLNEGYAVTIVYMTSGDAGSLQYSKTQLASLREEEARSAAAHLGINDLIFLGVPDGYIDLRQENLIRIIKLIRDKQPSTIYLPHSRDAVQDHLLTHQLILEASKRAAGPWFQECGGTPWSVNNLLGYEIWTPLESVSYVEDISDYIELKIAALQEHKSQIEPIKYHEAVRGLNRYRGVMSGLGDYCECFQVIKSGPLTTI